MKRFGLAGAAVALVLLAAPGAALGAASIENGSFESGTYTEGPWNLFYAGSTSVTGWTIENGSIDATFAYWVASDGTVSIDLNGQDAGTISQALTTTVGGSYVVSFDLAGNPACGPTLKTLTVSATGAAPEPMTFDTAGSTFGDMNWSTRQYAFVASDTATVLTFASSTAGTPCGPALDNVRLAETLPPPTTTVPGALGDCKDDGWMALTDSKGNAFKNQGDCVSYVASGGRNDASTPTRNNANTAKADNPTPDSRRVRARDPYPREVAPMARRPHPERIAQAHEAGIRKAG
jgi:choice-of-anchor C domain-containing protein